jgi:hypothetical protein
MIQYAISRQKIEQLIEQEKPGWLARAKSRTDNFAALGQYKESSSIWSEVKVVYMRLQHGKCAYCERQLEAEKYGKGEHDLEHFRPKKKAKPWELTQALQQAGVALTAPISGNADPGYHLLPYHPANYCTSCRPCNSGLKRDYFPISGTRSPDGNDPVQLSSEQPLLVNPVGDFDDDPATLISFRGLSPMAAHTSGHKRHRGLVCIAFFRLDDRRRKYLFRERADVIVSLYSFLEQAEQATTQAKRKVYERLVEVKTKASAPHTNCARCFRDLFQNDRNEADQIFLLADQYLQSISA